MPCFSIQIFTTPLQLNQFQNPKRIQVDTIKDLVNALREETFSSLKSSSKRFSEHQLALFFPPETAFKESCWSWESPNCSITNHYLRKREYLVPVIFQPSSYCVYSFASHLQLPQNETVHPGRDDIKPYTFYFWTFTFIDIIHYSAGVIGKWILKPYT